MIRYVYLGRFSPFHLGHERLLRAVVDQYRVDNCLVLIGSSSSLNDRTPYTYETRLSMIKEIFPEVEVLPLPDVRPDLSFFDGSTNNTWLDEISNLEKSRGEKFVFVGGSREDLEVLATRFETKVIYDRNEGENNDVSATKIREALKMVNPKLWKKIINFDFK